MRDTFEGYGCISRGLHWIMAFGVLCLMALGLWMTDLPNTPLKGQSFMIHKSIGLTLFFLFVFRIYWRMVNISPVLPEHLPRWQKTSAHVVHGFLYLYMLSMLGSGMGMTFLSGRSISWFGLWQVTFPFHHQETASLMHRVHVSLTDYAWIIVALHILVAFYHHWVLKDRILMRMIRGK